MGWILKLLTALSALSLAHSIFSAYEATLINASSSPAPTSQRISTTIPTDIRIQTLLSTFLLLVCIVSSAAPLRPIRWSEWAGKIEREGWEPNYEGEEKSKGGVGNPYRVLEDRRGFLDIRGARDAFAGWVREGGR